MARNAVRHSFGIVWGILFLGISVLPCRALDPNPVGVLELTNGANLVIEVSDAKNRTFPPSAPLHFELPVGDYWVRVRPVDDIGWVWTWSSRVKVTADVPVVVTIPETARTHSALWQTEHEKLQTQILQSLRWETTRKQKQARSTALWFLGLGGVSFMASGALYWMGTSQFPAYNTANNQDDAQKLHVQLAVESVAFVATAVAGLLGLGTGLTLLATAPDPEKKP